MHVKYLAYVAHLVGIFVSEMYLVVIGEVKVAGNCVAYMCNNVGSTWPYIMLLMLAVFGMWQLYLFSDVSNVCEVLLVVWLMSMTSCVV